MLKISVPKFFLNSKVRKIEFRHKNFSEQKIQLMETLVESIITFLEN